MSHAVVKQDGKEIPVATAINDDNWIKNEFLSAIQKRGAAVIAARKLSSALSAAKSVSDHMHDWWLGTKEVCSQLNLFCFKGEWVSMSVISDGSYDAPKDVIFSFPVQIKNGKWTIVQGLKLDEWAKGKFSITAEELKEERIAAGLD